MFLMTAWLPIFQPAHTHFRFPLFLGVVFPLLPVTILDGSGDTSMLLHVGLEGVLDDLPQRSLLPLGNLTCTLNPVSSYPHIKTATVLAAQTLSKLLNSSLGAHGTVL